MSSVRSRLFSLENQLLNLNDTADSYFIINAEDRGITPPPDFKNFGVESDENSERVWFKCDRYVGDNLDLSELNLRVNYQNANGDKDQFIVTDVVIIDDKVEFSWLLSRKATMYSGTLSFIVCAVKTNSNGIITNEWNTALCTGTVLGGLEVDAPEIPEDVTDVVSQLLDVTSKAITDAEAASALALSNIENAQTEAVNTVTEARDEAMEYIGNGIDKTLTRTNKAADAKVTGELVHSKAPAIVKGVTGESIVLNDSSEMPLKCLQIYGRTDTIKAVNGYQLFDASRLSSRSTGGLSIKNNGDGSFTLKATGSTMSAIDHKYELTHSETVALFKAGKLMLKSDSSSPYFYVGLYEQLTLTSQITNISGGVSEIEITQDMLNNSGFHLTFGFYSAGGGVGTYEVTVKPMVYQEGDGTFEPYSGGKSVTPQYPQELISVESPDVNIYGKNLLWHDVKNHSVNGIDVSVKVDGGITLNGTAESAADILLGNGYLYLPVGKYKLTGCPDGGASEAYTLAVRKSTDLSLTVARDYGDGCFLEITEDLAKSGIRPFIRVFAGTSVSNITYYPMISVDDGDYESYKTPQTLSLSHTLRGIPVESGGNYTDSDGQQWVCDEIDLERGVLIQRVGQYVFNGADSEVWIHEADKELFKLAYLNLNNSWNVVTNVDKSLMSHYEYDGSVWNEVITKYGYCINFNSLFIRHKDITTLDSFKEFISVNPIRLLYILPETTETSLTDEEITAFKALYNNYPVTTVLNDKGAYMGVKYAVDTETYINNNYVPLSSYQALEARVKALEGGV